MGLIKFALKGNYKNYYEKLKELSKQNGKSAIVMFIDTAFCTLRYKTGLQDYINYKFYQKKHKDRKTYASIGYQHEFYKIAAHWDYAPFFSNKINFHKNFKKYTKRKIATYEDGFEKVKEFILKREAFIKKPIAGLGGSNVEKILTKDIKNLEEFYENLNKDNCFLEELIIQHRKWNELNPNSVNTIRLVTKCINNKSDIVFAAARIGSGKSIADNFHQGGVGVDIDIEKGMLRGVTINKNNDENPKTSTGITVDGYKIPYWKEMVKMVKEAAKVNQNVHVVGWDIAITENGPLIIEGNRGPGMDLIQVLLNRGVKEDLEQIKKEILESK